MQNVDYRNNRKLSGAIKDLIVIDKHRMLYRGLFPFCFGCNILGSFTSSMDHGKKGDLLSHMIWPFQFLVGCIFAHPWMLVSLRVQCNPVTGNNKHYRDCFTAL